MYEPALVGVPDITPVVASSVKPAGRLPDDIDQSAYDVPKAESPSLYASPTLASGREGVSIVGSNPELDITEIVNDLNVEPEVFEALMVNM